MQHFRMRRWSVVIAILLLVISFGINRVLSGMKEPPKEEEQIERVVPVGILFAKNAAQNANIEISGRLSSSQKFDVFTEVNGRLIASKKEFKDGVFFQKGEILLHIDDQDIRHNLNASRSAFQSSIAALMADLKIDYPAIFEDWLKYLNNFNPEENLSPLPPVSSPKAKSFLVARNVYNQFYGIKAQEAQLAKYTIAAPFNGVVSSANINPSTVLRAGQRVGIFVDPNNFELEAGVNVSTAARIQVGNTVQLQSLDIPGSWNATITRKSEIIDASTQNVKVYMKVSGSELREGLYLHGNIQGDQIDSVVVIPRYLVINQHQIYAVQNDMLQLMDVEVVHANNDFVYVQGIPDGTKLANQVVPGAHPGMKVNIISTAP